MTLALGNSALPNKVLKLANPEHTEGAQLNSSVGRTLWRDRRGRCPEDEHARHSEDRLLG
jgi:hypothetical protein